ncbi:hypothetical protein SBA3_2960003 [Candidatus Sulfopaludibacter sp. SbA3]|nr:hypothetical protein SBA3_2960003 [Candidatus Sulfopaludibacter sp. SbA3]
MNSGTVQVDDSTWFSIVRCVMQSEEDALQDLCRCLIRLWHKYYSYSRIRLDESSPHPDLAHDLSQHVRYCFLRHAEGLVELAMIATPIHATEAIGDPMGSEDIWAERLGVAGRVLMGLPEPYRDTLLHFASDEPRDVAATTMGLSMSQLGVLKQQAKMRFLDQYQKALAHRQGFTMARATKSVPTRHGDPVSIRTGIA